MAGANMYYGSNVKKDYKRTSINTADPVFSSGENWGHKTP